ncbi:MAG: acylphosphatase [Anaerolineaceae bacterium]|nr:acylphosphatase [Anaerolineaceae bacterium]
MEDTITRWHVYFSGEVQGVGFRFTSQHFAQRLGLTGWVRNLHDDRVEMEAQGPRSALQMLTEQLQSAPPIRIENIEIEEVPVKEGEKRFSIVSHWF